MFDMLAVAQQLAGRRRRSANRPKTGAGDSRGLRPARFCQEQTRVLCGVSRLASCGGNRGFYAGFQRTDLLRAAGRPQRRGLRPGSRKAPAARRGPRGPVWVRRQGTAPPLSLSGRPDRDPAGIPSAGDAADLLVAAKKARDRAISERDAAVSERDTARSERDAAVSARDVAQSSPTDSAVTNCAMPWPGGAGW